MSGSEPSPLAPARPTVSHPVLTVGVPIFNEARYLAETLASLQRQSFADFAVLVSDNGSTDESAAIAAAFAREDSRFHLVQQPRNVGALANFAFAFHALESPLFMWLGGHDLLEPDFLARHVAAHRQEPGLSLSYSLARIVDPDGRPLAVLGDDRLSRMGGSQAWRYVQIPRHARGYMVNNVFRRSAIADFAFEFSPIWDAVLLSHAIYRGPFHCVEEPLYVLRDLHPPGSETLATAAARVGSDGGARASDSIVRAYDNDFRRVAQKDWRRPTLSIALRLLLEHRYAPAPGASAKLVRRLLGVRRRLLAQGRRPIS